MALLDKDVRLGQLALARGMVRLDQLLASVGRAVQKGEALATVLTSEELLIEEVVADLLEELETMDGTALQAAVDFGETIAFESLKNWESENKGALNQKLSAMQGIKDTLEAIGGSGPSPGPGTSELNLSALTGAEHRYEFLEELGRGGMGQILKAHDKLLDRAIALKTVLPEAKVEDPHIRLIAEARLTGRLEHPSIVPVYELGALSNGEPFYTMKVITERSLRQILDEIEAGTPGAPTLLQLVQILRQVCLAMQFAHDHGVIHRDLKPENILVGQYGEVFVIDWGIAKVLSLFDLPAPTDSMERKGGLLGTPLYMAPEQAQGDHESVDKRTDVYALGAILYEMMTLTPIFEARNILGLLMTIIQEEPLRPSLRAPQRKIPQALEEIALRAIAKEREDRYPSAQEMANELDLFLEGVKDREKKLAAARSLIEEGHKARQIYEESLRKLEERVRERDIQLRAIGLRPTDVEREALWRSEDLVEDLRIDVERHFGEATRLFSQSLVYVSLPEAHEILAEMYWERFIDAEDRRDRATAAYFESLVRQHDQGTYDVLFRGLASLRVEASPSTTELTLLRVVEKKRRLVAGDHLALGEGTLQIDRIPHGRHLLQARAKGYAPLEIPLSLGRQEAKTLRFKMVPSEKIPDDFIVVIPPTESGEKPFGIKRTPVTCGEYVEFLNDLAEECPAKAGAHAPRTEEKGPSYFPIVNGRFIVPQKDADGDAWDPRWPICIVNHGDALAYARWRSAREGRIYRLPTSEEWERAARGVDQRLYPWGDHFDPSFCMMRDSRPGKPMPVAVGTFPADRSPYGVVDMAGNISEWTASAYRGQEGLFVLRGGSYNSLSMMCRCDDLMHSPASYRFGHYGFRLALSLES